MNKFTIKSYEKILENIIDKALLKFQESDEYREIYWDLDKFFRMQYERRMAILKPCMSKLEYEFVMKTYDKHPELRRHIEWLSS